MLYIRQMFFILYFVSKIQATFACFNPLLMLWFAVRRRLGFAAVVGHRAGAHVSKEKLSRMELKTGINSRKPMHFEAQPSMAPPPTLNVRKKIAIAGKGMYIRQAYHRYPFRFSLFFEMQKMPILFICTHFTSSLPLLLMNATTNNVTVIFFIILEFCPLT